MQQKTLARSFTWQGIGIHTGQVGSIAVHPTGADTGRRFRVGDVVIPALAEFVTDTTRSTTLAHDGASVMTVEHLLSALHAFGVDNCEIEVTGPEIPILDGSALPFAEAIRDAGTIAQDAPRRVLTLDAPFTLEVGATQIAVEPDDAFLMEVQVDFAQWPEGDRSLAFTLEPDAPAAYLTQIAPARTFAFRQEVDALLAAGLAKGGSLDNALIITPPDTFSTPLRVPNEWCAHKVLDVIGDLALLGAHCAAQVRIVRPGHRANTTLARELRARLADT